MTKTAATWAARLALLVLAAGACTVNIDVDPGIDLGSDGETEGSVGGLLDSALDLGGDGAGAGRTAEGAAPALRAPDRDDESPVILINPPPTATTDPGVSSASPADSPGGSTAEAGDPETTATPGDTTPTTATTGDTTPTTATAAGSAPSGDEDLPGESYEYGPDEGMSLAVVGVDHDDVLNVRDIPFGEIIATLGLANPIAFLLEVSAMPSGEPIDWFDSWSGAIVATGRTRKLPTTVWHEIQVAGVTGWASGAYLAPIGLTDDITAHLIDRLGERPEADTLIDLALIVGEAFASSEPPSRVVVTVGPTIFEALGEVTVDVLNLGDDSLLGFRLDLSADPAGDWMSENPGPFTLRTVRSTILCYSHRGVTADGLCV